MVRFNLYFQEHKLFSLLPTVEELQFEPDPLERRFRDRGLAVSICPRELSLEGYPTVVIEL